MFIYIHTRVEYIYANIDRKINKNTHTHTHTHTHTRPSYTSSTIKDKEKESWLRQICYYYSHTCFKGSDNKAYQGSRGVRVCVVKDGELLPT